MMARPQTAPSSKGTRQTLTSSGRQTAHLMRPPDVGHVGRRTCPPDAWFRVPALERFLGYGPGIRRIGRSVQCQLDLESLRPRALDGADRQIEALRPQHPADDGDPERGLSRLRLGGVPLRGDSRASNDSDGVGMSLSESEVPRILIRSRTGTVSRDR